MPRILPEEQNLYGDGSSSEVSSSEESFQIISEATYSSTKVAGNFFVSFERYLTDWVSVWLAGKGEPKA